MNTAEQSLLRQQDPTDEHMIEMTDQDADGESSTARRSRRSSAGMGGDHRGCGSRWICCRAWRGMVRTLRCMGRRAYLERTIRMAGDGSVTTEPEASRHLPNVVKNHKYNVLTFVPLVLYQQFRFFFNFFFLCVALAQLVPVLRVGNLVTYLTPLVFVISVTMIKEAADDLKRYRRDREVNGQKYRKLTPHEGFREVTAADIRVGDIIQVNADQRVPCDLLFLKTTEKGGSTFLRTDQLDGETDWKLRRPVPFIQALRRNDDIFRVRGELVAEKPRRDIYEFMGCFTVFNKRELLQQRQQQQQRQSRGAGDETALGGVQSERPGGDQEAPSASAAQWPAAPAYQKSDSFSSQGSNADLGDVVGGSPSSPRRVSNVSSEPLTLENTLWANTVVSSGQVLGVAIYTGVETRSAMNTQHTISKVGLLDMEINFFSKILCVILLSLAFLLVCTRPQGLTGIWYIHFFRFILLLSSIIPISMRVNLDMAKALYSLQIARDWKIPETKVRTSSIPEELGRIDYLLSDKTGTLTKNEMIFKKIHLGFTLFTEDTLDELRATLKAAFTDSESAPPPLSANGGAAPQSAMISRVPRQPRQASKDGSASSGVATPSLVSTTSINNNNDTDNMVTSRRDSGMSSSSLVGARLRRADEVVALQMAVVALGLCHNVTPLNTDKGVSFQASSPDEVALVTLAKRVGLQLRERDASSMTLEAPDGREVSYDILACFPFSSETKRMGIIVRERWSGRILFFVKGAESVMMSMLRQKASGWLAEECGNFARDGLRTLVVAYRELAPQEFQDFNTRYGQAKASLKTDRIRSTIAGLERELQLLALTGVEDKLQEDVKLTLEKLQEAKVKVWMLTGDKVETATCIAISAGLKSRLHSLHVLTSKEITTTEAAVQAIHRFGRVASNSVLVLDGALVGLFLRVCPELFVSVAGQAPSVVCCRCSPTQKAEVVRAIKSITKGRTCAIGDGGNDVSMIQAADMGVGIVGKEGMQAALAADISIVQFRYLLRLLLWHGRNSYQRSSRLAQFVIHRGLVIAIIQVLFSAIFYCIPVGIFQNWLMVGYGTYYTMAPVFALVLDVELPESTVFMYPMLYETLRSGRILSLKTFFGWVWKSTYQGCVIMGVAVLLFQDSFLNIVAICFTALILSELLNVASEVRTWHPLMIAAEIVTVHVYVFSMFIIRSQFDIYFIMTLQFWGKVAAMVALSWLPIHMFQLIRRFMAPPQYAKLYDEEEQELPQSTATGGLMSMPPFPPPHYTYRHGGPRSPRRFSLTSAFTPFTRHDHPSSSARSPSLLADRDASNNDANSSNSEGAFRSTYSPGDIRVLTSGVMTRRNRNDIDGSGSVGSGSNNGNSSGGGLGMGGAMEMNTVQLQPGTDKGRTVIER